MERDLLMTGVGGQGVQLAAQLLARAALADGREAQLFGSYGGMMRGGNTDTTLVVGDAPIEAPPTTDRAWAAILLHHQFAAPALAHLRPGGIVFVNASLVAPPDTEPDREPFVVASIPATDLAVDAGNIVTAAMVMIGAFAAATGIVRVSSLLEVLPGALPTYRHQHLAVNEAAIELGAVHAPAGLPRAWDAADVPHAEKVGA